MSTSYIGAAIAAGTKSAFGTRGQFLFRASMMALNNIVFFSIWLVLFRQVPSLGGWGLDDMMLLFGFGAVAFGVAFAVGAGFSRIPEMLRSGELYSILLRPRSALALTLVSRPEPYAYGDIVSGVALIAISGRLDLVGWITLVPVVMLSACVILSAGAAFYSLAFWLQRSDEISGRLFETMITFSLYPDAIFPWGLKVVFYTIIPAAFSGSFAARVLQEPSVGMLAGLIAVAIGWVCAAVFIFNRGVRRLVRS